MSAATSAELERAPGGVELGLRLYVAGDSPNSQSALANLRALLADLCVAADLEIVDVLQQPERGMREGILVTPTLVKLRPTPVRTIIGNLGDRTIVADALSLAKARHE